MNEFLCSRAGRQLILVSAGGLVVWLCCLLFRGPILHAVEVASAGRTHLIIITLMVAGTSSFIYSGLRILAMRSEMLARRKAFEKADYIATHDNLTKLPNRYSFDRYVLSPKVLPIGNSLPDAVREMATVFSIDLDGFKKVNDLLGHQGGDALLKEVARRICALANHECVFRFGGDEFVVIAQDMPPEKEALFAKLLIHSISRAIHIGSHPTAVGASVGYARLPEHGASLEEVRHCSDIALYEAKGRAHNQHSLFQWEMQENVTARAKLEGELRSAIEDRSIVPFYQPLIDLKTGSLCGFEALARWRKLDGTFVPPDRFIPVAEETGLITTLFSQLLQTACRDAAAWPEHLTLSFNVSPIQIEDRLLVNRILQIMKDTGFGAPRLEIEITENALMGDPDLAAATLQKLHAAGIQVALDDFGTGYSSLSQLARFQFDKIKIDKSFVSGSVANEKNAKIIGAILSLGRSLNLKTTVEGIEENSQLGYYLGQGCDFGQGYLFGKAMPQEEVPAFIRNRTEILRVG
ncbi:diguanylate cyclase (GGDEF)-like protein [Pararhizobium capsulatum DSM 1112]|uniref:Diguanylate cyclase (GGDEF)-like protein n=1 Tax=Pararhizobium capsulatum DSM 1112 TaxID=1121113 RepID=A0ABU0BZ87_9HYPH|nr:EAL domain-containing protein [Pararhizobium capsulatum]MDQ0323577.1 diguanylate cyclase (GGDEF)-like protein [Pararhizobium capsulatum DSM 1112]